MHYEAQVISSSYCLHPCTHACQCTHALMQANITEQARKPYLSCLPTHKAHSCPATRTLFSFNSQLHLRNLQAFCNSTHLRFVQVLQIFFLQEISKVEELLIHVVDIPPSKYPKVLSKPIRDNLVTASSSFPSGVTSKIGC